MSDLQENIDVPFIYDHDYEGGADTQGEIKQLYGKDALANVVKMWIASFMGDVLREPRRGGYITYWLLKPMNEVAIDNIKMAIRSGLSQDFTPYLEIVHLDIVPHYDERYWEFNLELYSPILKMRVSISEKLKALT
jgi:hypothetical protein